MRLPLLLAGAAVLFSVTYRYVFSASHREKGAEKTLAKAVLGWFGTLVVVGVLSLIKPLQGVADLVCYVIIAVVVLNDGYESINSLVKG